MHEFDVLIVGGGPAGSTLAWALDRTDSTVAVIDKQSFPRDKVCAGWVTPAVMTYLQLDKQDYARTHTIQPICGFRVSVMGQRQVEIRYTQPVSYSIRRYEFDNYLLERVDATLFLKTPLKKVSRHKDHWIINDQITAKMLVGAGGHFCPIARFLGAKLGSTEIVVVAQEIEFEMTASQSEQCSVSGDVPELFFCEDLKGYGWVVRKNNFLNIGLGREDNHRLGEHVANFRAFLIEHNKIPGDTPERFHGHAYLLYPRATRPVVSNAVMLIGDAAGLAYSQSGEGIRPAIESALFAAEAIREAKSNYSTENLEVYRDRLVRQFGQRNRLDIADRFPAWLKQFAAEKCLSTPWLVRHFVLDRWFLHTHQALKFS